MTVPASTSSPTISAPPGSRWTLLIAAVGFLLFYLLTDFVAPALASSSLPLPDDPTGETRGWYADNGLAAVAMAGCQFLSVCFLGLFAMLLPGSNRLVQAGGLVAMTLMMVSSALGCFLAAVAEDASLDTVSVLRTASFVAGGAAHVVVLGVFVRLASLLRGFTRKLRVFAVVVLVVSLASLSSLVWFYGSAFILLGRLLAMIWVISAAVNVARRATL